MNPLRALFLSLSRMPPALMLVLIVGLAIVVTMLVMNQVGEQQRSLKEQQAALQAKLEQKATVVYATKDIPEGATIASDALEEKQVGAGEKPVDALESSAMAVGRIAKAGIATGQIVSSHDLAPVGMSSGFEAKIKDGYRAVTFPADMNTGVAGFVAPGSHVDVVAYVGTGRETKAAPILSDVEVIAVGQNYQRQPAGGSAGGGGGGATQMTTVTVALTPSDSDKLIKGMKAASGNLYLTLRNEKDHAPVPTVDVTSLFEKPQGHSSELASLPPPPGNLPPLGGGPGGGLGGLPAMAPPPPALHEVEQWAGGSKEVRSVPKD